MSTAAELPCYTLINLSTDVEPPSEVQLKQDIEKGDIRLKTEALKKVIQLILNGEKMPSILMTVVKYLLPLTDHTVKKLLLIFWEIVPKTTQDGKLMQEMILVCDAYRRDLQHPNEYIRGSTLRFLCKLKEAELLEPLMPAIRQCLEHRVSYVRRNAVLAIYTIYRNFEGLIPDAPELISTFLIGEQDASCKRNAFMMLVHVDQDRALDYLSSCIDQVHTFGDILQLVIVELIYKVCSANPSERARFIRCIYNLLNSTSPSVRYEAAGTLVTLSSAPTAIKAAAHCYIDLIVKESDNNVKLIVLDRLMELKDNPAHERVMQDLVMDVLRVLSAPDTEVRKKTLNLALELVSSRNIEEMVLVLRKEVQRTQGRNEEFEDMTRYCQLLVRTLHSCCMRFPDVTMNVVSFLMEFLGDMGEVAAADVMVFVREAIARLQDPEQTLISRLIEVFPSIRSVKICRAALWVLGQFCRRPEDMQGVMTLIRQSLGELPIVEDELKQASKDDEGSKKDDGDEQMQRTVTRLITADGTYATQSALTSSISEVLGMRSRGRFGRWGVGNRPPLRGFLMDGDFFIGAALATDLTKLAVEFCQLPQYDAKKKNAFVAEAMFILASIIHAGKSGLAKKSISDDDLDRMVLCLRILSDITHESGKVCTVESLAALRFMLETQHREEMENLKALQKKKAICIEADDPISFLQLTSTTEIGAGENLIDLSLSQATGRGKENTSTQASKLNKVTQLTGFSDPIYAEAYIHVNQYDIVLDVLIVNQTKDTLQNVTVELATLGDLKLVEKPPPVTLAPQDFCNIKANVKVSSTENGVIFGNIVYDVAKAGGTTQCVVLSDIHIDIMDYIVGASCTDTEFRQMWAEFEWENKVTVNTNVKDLHGYLKHILSCTNMRCLTPDKALSGNCGFMAANLYARSIFGEDALANISIEKPAFHADAPVQGHIRIRAKSQGMALSLGDRINQSQKAKAVNLAS